jgi:hypothetical protein
MELIKFLKELKNNKYLTLNQLEYDIQKLKNIVDNPNLKFDYVKPKGLKNYINDLKSAADYGKKKLMQTASDAYKAISKIMPKYQPKSDDDIYLILGFLLFLDDDEIDSFSQSNDDILALIAMLLIDSKTPRKNQPLDRQFRQKLIHLPYNVIFDTFENFTRPTYIMEAILNQIFSFLILSTYLLQDNKVCFSSQDVDIQPNDFLTQLNITDKNKFVSIGLGNALTQWTNTGTNPLFRNPDVKLNSEAAASYTSIQMMKNLLQELYTSKIVDLGSGNQGYVGVKQDNTPNKYSSTCVHVWGANIANYNNENDTPINGGGQATAFNRVGVSSQTPGVFGIISTNILMESITDNNDRYKKVLKQRWDWLNIENKDYILFYNVLKTIIKCNVKNNDTVTQLLDYINKIMSTIAGYDDINREFIDIHSTLYTEAETVPDNHNEIIISYDKESSHDFSLMTIKVIIKDESSNLFYDRNNKYLNLNLEKLKDACLKQDKTITFYNLEDLEEYIDEDEEDDDEDTNLQDIVDSAKSEMNELLKQIHILEEKNKLLTNSTSANKENNKRLIQERSVLLDLITEQQRETKRLLKEEEDKYTKLDLDKTKSAQRFRGIIIKLRTNNAKARSQMKITARQLTESKQALNTSQEQINDLTTFVDRLQLELEFEKASAIQKQTAIYEALSKLEIYIAEVISKIQSKENEIESLKSKSNQNDELKRISHERISLMTRQIEVMNGEMTTLQRKLQSEKESSDRLNEKIVKISKDTLELARAEVIQAQKQVELARAEADLAHLKAEQEETNKIRAREKIRTLRKELSNANKETADAREKAAKARETAEDDYKMLAAARASETQARVSETQARASQAVAEAELVKARREAATATSAAILAGKEAQAAQEELDRANSNAATARQEAATARQEADAAHQETESARRETESAITRAEAALAEAAESRVKEAETRLDAAKAHAKLRELEGDYTQTIDTLTTKVSELTSKNIENDAKLVTTSDELKTVKAELIKIKEENEELKHNLSKSYGKFAELNDRYAEILLKYENSGKNAAEAIAELKSVNQDLGETVRRLIEEARINKSNLNTALLQYNRDLRVLRPTLELKMAESETKKQESEHFEQMYKQKQAEIAEFVRRLDTAVAPEEIAELIAELNKLEK